MSSYVGRYAEFYDLIYAEKPYAEEVAFIDRAVTAKLGRRPQKWLDVACGTGTHALCLAAHGYDVVGLDYSTDQLAQARRKADEQRATVRFDFADMRALELGAERFDVISCLFDSIGYAKTNEAILAAFQGMKRHLTAGGLIVLEFWHAAAMLKYYEPSRTRRWPLASGELVRVSDSTLNIALQTCTVNYKLSISGADGSCTSFSETQENRFFLLQEMGALLKCAGLDVLEAFAGYTSETPITDQTWHVVMLAAPAA